MADSHTHTNTPATITTATPSIIILAATITPRKISVAHLQSALPLMQAS